VQFTSLFATQFTIQRIFEHDDGDFWRNKHRVANDGLQYLAQGSRCRHHCSRHGVRDDANSDVFCCQGSLLVTDAIQWQLGRIRWGALYTGSRLVVIMSVITNNNIVGMRQTQGMGCNYPGYLVALRSHSHGTRSSYQRSIAQRSMEAVRNDKNKKN